MDWSPLAKGTWLDRAGRAIALLGRKIIILGGGKPLFKDVNERHALTLLEGRPMTASAVSLRYSVPH